MSESNYIKIIKQICHESDIEVESFSDDWVLKLTKGEKVRYIIGYQFGLNLGSVQSICNDKNATSEILNSFDIPCVEHSLFMSDSYYSYVSKEENEKNMIDILNRYKEVVCKPNEGTGGSLVYHVKNKEEMREASSNILDKYRTMAISPYIDIEEEYRVIVLKGKVKLIYSKNRPCIVGNGKDTIKLLYNQYASDMKKASKYNFSICESDLNKVLKKDEVYNLEWRHNLGNGAIPNLNIDSSVKEILSNIGVNVCEKLGINFASVDIIKCSEGYKVLEINGGVMMEYFSRVSEDNFLIAKQIYKEAILSMFDD